MRDIPEMYQSYIKITSKEELGIIDSIGDYLLYGKQICGDNAHDKPLPFGLRIFTQPAAVGQRVGKPTSASERI